VTILTCGMFLPLQTPVMHARRPTNHWHKIVSDKLSRSRTLTIVVAQTEGIQGNSGMDRTPRQSQVRMFSDTEVSSMSRC
jgi:hypothetical protein